MTTDDGRALRAGDLVRLIDPRFIIRLDYEVTVRTLAAEVAQDPEVAEFLRKQGISEHLGRAFDKVCLALAYCRMAQRKQKGARRELVLGEVQEELRGQVFTIVDRAVRKTGEYYPPYYWSGGWSDEPDWEPGGLAGERTWVCYELSGVQTVGTPMAVSLAEYRPHWPHRGRWVTLEQVQRVIGEEMYDDD